MIWGVSFGSHNSAISVFENNELVFATDGERFSKTKNDKNLCNELLDFCGVPEKVFYYENPFLKSERRKFAGQTPELILPDFKYPLTYSNHHRSHASYGYYTSPYDDAIVLVLDAINAFFAAAGFSSGVESTIPKTFFWFGQIINQTLKAIIKPSHIPIPIAVFLPPPLPIPKVIAW